MSKKPVSIYQLLSKFIKTCHFYLKKKCQFFSNQDSDLSQEPIYQNQAELRSQLQKLDKGVEPIYQNLPAHEKLMLLQEKKLLEAAKLQVSEIDDNEDASSTSTTKIKGHVSRVAITNSREDLSNSQHSEYISPSTVQQLQPESNDVVDRKKSVTKINIGTTLPVPELSIHDNLKQPKPPQQLKQKAPLPAVTTPAVAQVSNVQQQQNKQQNTKAIVESPPVPTSLSETEISSGQFNNPVVPKVKSPPKKPARAKASQSVENITTISDETALDNTVSSASHFTPSSKANTIHTPRTPSSKPRAGRKRWAFNFGGSKTGSLKSLKSIKSSGEDDEDKK